MSSFVNLEAGNRTYIASVKARPNFSLALREQDKDTRKLLANMAQRGAENKLQTTLNPQLDSLVKQGLLTSYEHVAGTGAMLLNVPDAKAGAAYDALRGIAELGRIVRNRSVELDATVGAIEPPAAQVEYNVEKVKANEVWKSGVNGAGIVVGIVDTGANTMHEALKAQYRGTAPDGTQDHNYNWFDPVGGKKVAYDDHNHGTHVAGTSVGGTAQRQIGMAPGAQFIATKVFTAGGSGSTATILKGLSWMLAPTDLEGRNPDPTKAPDIVSNSWGSSNGKSLTYLDAWKAFEAAGIIPVVAAGNSGPSARTVGSPGSYAQSISVAATDKDDKIASFSSRGPSPIKDAAGKELQKPDVAAPGVKVVSAGKDGGYMPMSGTSMATPGVSGVIALLLSKYPTLKVEQVREILAKSAVDLGAAGWDPEFGNGRVDAVAAMALADRMFATA